MEQNTTEILKKCTNTQNIFETFCKEISSLKFYNCVDLRNKKKIIGDIWEEFCKKYLKEIKEYKQVKLLAELSDEERELWSLKKKDVGIDIICIDTDDTVIAVQCKFRSKGNITWREISTFEALCARTGPWKYHLVMTNVPRINREGKTNPKDKSITKYHFDKLERHLWNRICGFGNGNTFGDDNMNFSDIKECWLQKLSNNY